MLYLLVWLEPGSFCSKARIFALELLPKEDSTLDTWNFEVILLGHLDMCVPYRSGL